MNNKPSILLVDDEEDLLSIMKDYLTDKYNIFTASNGAQALDVVKIYSSSLDVVISDINMPEMNGIALLKELRSSFPNVSVIMLSGQGDIKVAIESMTLGAFDYITKPILVFDELDIRLNRLFEKRKLENQLVEFMRLRDTLMSQIQVLSFVSIDVVDSHGLKLGADVLLAQFSFMEYHNFIREKIAKYSGKINNTAGDGIMCSFDSAQSAVEAGIDIQNGLKDFNQFRNKLQRPFRLRLGIHTGNAVMDREGKVEQTFARVLDVAGHIQKRAGENDVFISKESFDEIANKTDFLPMNQEVDGVPIFKFKGR